MAQPSFDPEYLSVTAIARLVSLHRRTILRAIDAKELPAVKIGGVWRIPVAAYRAWTQANLTEEN